MKKIVSVLLIFLLAGFCNFVALADVKEEKPQQVVSILKESETGLSEIDYSNYIANYLNSDYATCDIKSDLNIALNKSNFTFEAEIQQSGLYKLGVSYKAIDNGRANFVLGFQLDGKYPFSQARHLELPRMWKDAGDIRTDGVGNEFAPEQVYLDDFYYNDITDMSSEYGDKFYVFLCSGTHKITLSTDNAIEIEYFKFGKTEKVKEYDFSGSEKDCYKGKSIIIEAENAEIKSSYSLVGKTDSSSIDVTPHNAKKNVINYIGGGNWKTIGETLVWNTPELKAGYYRLGFSYRQNSVIGGKTYRALAIDGKVPFSEASQIGFKYDDDWKSEFFADDKGNPYLIYFSEGKHTLSLTVTAGDIATVRSLLSEAVSDLGKLYVDITMITGENVDAYRDYELFKQITDMEERLINLKGLLNEAAEKLLQVTGQNSGSNYSIINNMIEIIEQMLNNKFEAHRYKNSYYSNYCSVSSVLQELRNMPLDLDKITLTSVDEQKPFETQGFFKQVLFSIERFIVSFQKDYNTVSDLENGGIKVWVNWGRDQAQVLSSLIDNSFTPKTGIGVNLQLVNASVIQATLSGNGPDCILQHSRSEPVNLAMRGVLYDLSKFDDCDEVLKRFQSGAELPYMYKNGLYALPDTQHFFMMFYRKDILAQLGLSVPKTWDEFKEISKTLTRNNMSVWLPNSVATDVTQVNAGIGSINIFPSLLLQQGLSIYSENGKSTNLLSSDVMEVFSQWTDYYRKLKFPVTLDFYNRFRVGTAPLGIAAYNLYTTLKVAAPEIDGLWSFTAIPGTLKDDGTLCRATSGGGTGCAILKKSNAPEKAWEFLKWWTDSQTQAAFSNNVESIIGPAGRVCLSNVEAIKDLAWDDGMLDELLSAWEQVEEIPEYPGSYYVSRSVYQSFWNVVNQNQNTKDMLMRYGKEADDEIARKWRQYQNK